MDSPGDVLRAFFEDMEIKAKAAARKATKKEAEDARDIASAWIDRIFVFKGEKTNPRQELEWPRKGVPGFSSDEFPDCLLRATFFLAGAHLAGYRIGPDNLELSKQLVGSLFWILDPVVDGEASARNTHRIH